MFTKLKLLFKGGGKIDLTPILKNVRDIEIEPFDCEGGSGESGGFDLDTFKQNIVDTYNKTADTPITTDNVIMPDAFIMNKNFSYDGTPQAPDLVDVDLTQFLASFCCNLQNAVPLYLKDSFDNNNLYFGLYGNKSYALMPYVMFNRQQTYDNIPDGIYDGNLNLEDYVSLKNTGEM